MRILHSGSLNIESGGPALSTYLTIRGLRQCGDEVEMVTTPLSEGEQLIAEDVSMHDTAPVCIERLGYMPGLKRLLHQLPTYDVYHIQGLWQYLGHGVAQYARSVNRPYIITLRGMLYPQALAHSTLVKKISLALYQSHDLKCASCIQATCTEELVHYRNLGYRNPVAVLPNPIDINGIVNRPIPLKEVFRIGYLGRLHPRKRIERLIYAFADLREQLADAQLVIIGGGDETYEEFLRSEVSRLDVRNVIFTGFVSGKEKDDAIMSLSLLVVPSDFENFGNVVSEALVRGVPVIASTGTPWQVLAEYECGWWVANDQDTINNTILEAISISHDMRFKMGINGKRLMRERFSVESIGEKMAELYLWLAGEAPRPEFVHVD